jgi:hypothetical protein
LKVSSIYFRFKINLNIIKKKMDLITSTVANIISTKTPCPHHTKKLAQTINSTLINATNTAINSIIDHSKMDHSKMDHSKMESMEGMDHSGMNHGGMVHDGMVVC